MSGRFAIAGRVFAKSDDEGCLGGVYEINKLFSDKEKDDISTMLILHLNELLPKDGEWECDYEPGSLSFMSWEAGFKTAEKRDDE